jgi:hypothetical protein
VSDISGFLQERDGPSQVRGDLPPFVPGKAHTRANSYNHNQRERNQQPTLPAHRNLAVNAFGTLAPLASFTDPKTSRSPIQSEKGTFVLSEFTQDLVCALSFSAYSTSSTRLEMPILSYIRNK